MELTRRDLLKGSVAVAAVVPIMVRNGVTERSALYEVNFIDASAVKYLTGMEIQQMTLSATAQQVITGVFTFVGKESLSDAYSRQLV